jgi:hypothetical protein
METRSGSAALRCNRLPVKAVAAYLPRCYELAFYLGMNKNF